MPDVQLSKLVPWDRNPRKNDRAAQKLAEFIEVHGWAAPILAQKGTHRIIDGHARHKAASLLGLKKVPVHFIDCDDETAVTLGLACNKLAEVAVWDDPQLAQILDELTLEGVELMGWDSRELEKLANSVTDFGPLASDDSGVHEVCPECGQKVKGV